MWQDIVEERNRKERLRRLASTQASVAQPAAVAPPPPPDDGGFFGFLKPVGDVAGAVGGFFGNMAADIFDTTKEAVGTGIDMITSIGDQNLAETKRKVLDEARQKLVAAKDAGQIDDNAFKEGIQKITNEYTKNSKELSEGKILKRDPLKSAAAVAETALNVGTLGSFGAATQLAKQTGKQVAKEGVKSLSGQAVKKIAQNAGEGAVMGTAYGALAPFKEKGSDATLDDVGESATQGALFGGAFGGAASLLDKQVRAGLRQIPADIRTGVLKTATKNQPVTRIPLDDLTSYEGAPDRARVDYYKKQIESGAEPDPIIAMRDSTGALGIEDGKHRAQAYRELGITDVPVKLTTAEQLKTVTQGGYIGPGDDAIMNNTSNRPGAEVQKQIEDALNIGDRVGAQRIIDAMPEGDLKAGMQSTVRALERPPTEHAAMPDFMRSAASGADDGAEQIAQDVAAGYNNADDYIRDRAAGITADAKASKGGQLIDRSGPNDPYGSGAVRISEHTPFYSQYYKQYGRPPSKAATEDAVKQALENGTDGGGLIHPEEARVYQILREREGAFDAAIKEGPPADMFAQFNESLTGRAQPQRGTRMPALPKGPGRGQQPLNGLAPEDARVTPPAFAEARTQAETRAREDNLVDFIDPGARTTTSTQADLLTPDAPYAGMEQDLTRPALPAGNLPGPLSPKEAKKQFKKTGEAPAVLNEQPTGKSAIELAETANKTSEIAVRETKGGKLKPVATNNAHITKDDVAAIRAIADDDTGSRFTATRTPEMNLEEAFAKRGGANSKEFKTLSKFNTSIREHSAEYTKWVDNKRSFLEKFRKEYGINGKSAQAMRPYLEAADDKVSTVALQEYRDKFGDKAAEGLQLFRTWWRKEKDIVRSETNAVIERFAGKDRTIGDLGETYVPRVYKTGGIKGFREAVLDVAHAGLDKIGGKKGLFNLETGGGYLSKETDTAASGVLRGSEGIPLNSAAAKPNTVYLSAAQKRTANSPIQDMEDPLTSIMRYFEATGRAKYYTEDIARGRTMQKAIEMINNETGNLRQMYQAFDDQIGSIANKTSRIDRPFVDSKAGNNFVNVATKLQRNTARSTILGSASSVLAQTGQLPLVVAENGVNNTRKGLRDMFKFLRGSGKDPLEQSALMSTRYPSFEDVFTTGKGQRAAQKGTEVVAKPFRLVERMMSEFAWRSSYNRAVGEGLTGKAAIQEADRIAAKVIGERSVGARAALYESRALGPVTAYTLEVNQLYQVAKQYFKRDPKKAVKLVGAIWLYNQAYEQITGNKLNADPLAAGLDAMNTLTSDQLLDENGQPIGVGERLVRAGGRLAGEALDATPLGGPVAGQLYPEQGFRVPFGGGERTLSREDIFGSTNFGRYGGGTPLASGISNPLMLLGIPGMAQAQRSVEGANAVEQGASMTPSGRVRFNIDDNPENYWRALLFGMYGTEEGRAYLRAQNARLSGQSGTGGVQY